jgi:Xaa-Pro aminopeptidase
MIEKNIIAKSISAKTIFAKTIFESKFQSFHEVANPKTAQPRVGALRTELTKLKLDGFLVPRSDEHQGEYVPKCEERLEYISGFTGSAGFALILKNKAAIFIDGRYTLQIKQQVDVKLFTPVPSLEPNIREWLVNTVPANARIGYDPRLHTAQDLERLGKMLHRISATLIAVKQNPIDLIWDNRPPAPKGMVTIHPKSLAGEISQSKIERITHALLVDRVDALLVSDPHNIAWAFNIRGSDVAHTPIALCYALIPADGTPTLFIDPAKISDITREHLTVNAELASPDELNMALRQAAACKRKIRLDKTTASIHLKTLVEQSSGIVDLGEDPITKMKAIKNNSEITGTKAAHLRDGAALVQFLAWLDVEAPKGHLTEIDTVKALEHFRRKSGMLKDVSFPTISGFGANGAIVHYRVTEQTNKQLTKGLFLIDSGGQYTDGTTDVTRTISIGTPTADMKNNFTRVLKGMIAISKAVFPKGTNGAQIDVLARQFLWQAGRDYDHGTGHGVGSYLSVHEGPQRISKTGNVALKAGMILSNEPGYYKPKSYGIRIENLILVEPHPFKDSNKEFLSFETLTLAPIDKSLIMRSLLDKNERNWLNAYHAKVWEKISPLVPEKTRIWLEQACAPF